MAVSREAASENRSHNDFRWLEEKMFAWAVHRDVRLRVFFQSAQHVPQRFAAMDENIRIHQKQEARVPGRERMHELVPGIDLSAFLQLDHARAERITIGIVALVACQRTRPPPQRSDPCTRLARQRISHFHPGGPVP